MISLFLLKIPQRFFLQKSTTTQRVFGGRIPPWSERIPAQGPTSLACEAAGGFEKHQSLYRKPRFLQVFTITYIQ